MHLHMQQPDSIDTTERKLIDHAKNNRGINEKEDFLHQIRAKVSVHYCPIGSQIWARTGFDI